jgi:hypothetical protein
MIPFSITKDKQENLLPKSIHPFLCLTHTIVYTESCITQGRKIISSAGVSYSWSGWYLIDSL